MQIYSQDNFPFKKNEFLLNGKLSWEFNFFQTNGKTRQQKQDKTRQDITTRNGIVR